MGSAREGIQQTAVCWDSWLILFLQGENLSQRDLGDWNAGFGKAGLLCNQVQEGRERQEERESRRDREGRGRGGKREGMRKTAREDGEKKRIDWYINKSTLKVFLDIWIRLNDFPWNTYLFCIHLYTLHQAIGLRWPDRERILCLWTLLAEWSWEWRSVAQVTMFLRS